MNNREEKLKDLIQKVEAWAEERNLIKLENAPKQYLKFLEETGELARALLKNDVPEIIDSFGDVLVTVIILAKQLGKPLSTNLYSSSYDVEGELSPYEFVNLLSTYYVSEEIIDVIDLVAKSHGYDSVECLEVAYNVISKRTGKVINGSYVKDDWITEEYLLNFGFTKVEEIHEEYHSVYYQLETKEVFFSYSDDWSLAIADSKKSFEKTSNYITPNKELTNKVHLWQQLFKSLTGKDTYVREDW